MTNTVLKNLNKQFIIKCKSHDVRGVCKLKGELNRVYSRRSRLLREITRSLPHFLAAVMVKKRCHTLKIEELSADPTGTKGALAKAIYNMPDSVYIYKKAVWLASIELGYDVKLETVSPFHTSSRHFGCGGTLDRTPSNYDIAPCKKCNQDVNTHKNAALNIASLQGNPLPYDFFPSPHV